MQRTPLSAYLGYTGFLRDWFVTGFFPNGVIGGESPDLFEAKRSRHWEKDYLAPWGGETALRDVGAAKGIAGLEWQALQAPKSYPKLDLREHCRMYPELAAAMPQPWDHCWYALSLVECDTAQEAELRFNAHDGCRLWWNGELAFEEHSWHKAMWDLFTLKVSLRKGRNVLLMKLDRYGLTARLTAAGGGRLKGKACTLTNQAPREDLTGTFGQLARYADTLKVEMPCRARSAAEYRTWAKKARAHMHRCLGRMPAQPRTAARKIEQVECEGYTRYLFRLRRECGSEIPVHVLVPPAGKFNGRTVICPHGHGQDDKTVVGLVGPEKPYGNWHTKFTGNYAQLLAQQGFLTACWGERVLSHEREDRWGEEGGDGCDKAGLCAVSMSMTLPGLHLFDLHGVTDFVQRTFKQVNPARLGLTGLSGGATMTYIAGAYDDRFKAVAPFCGVLSYQEYGKIGGCGQQIIPFLFPTLDSCELLCLIAPRPLLLAQATQDISFDVPRVKLFAAQVKKVYATLGHKDKAKLHLYPRGHQLDIDAAGEFFLRSL